MILPLKDSATMDEQEERRKGSIESDVGSNARN
jgi:hypothetical protein